ncbi:hypothetical protein ACH6EH_14340 [Paenibacillus sp. JSM ZJ436]|uniref:hypothetical protein n=1 Tax=Paenibacillus sp. JSM ZJ436 TaxID=3376190 RepID=UPI0037A1E424
MKSRVGKWILLCGLILMMTTTVGAASGSSQYTPVEHSEHQLAVFMQSFTKMNGQLYAVVDRIEWYEGEEANEIFRQREGDADMTEAPDGYYIVNDQEEQITLPVSDSAQVFLQLYDHTGAWEDAQIIWNQEVRVTKFHSIFQNDKLIDMSWFPYHLTVENGEVTQIIQQYIP